MRASWWRVLGLRAPLGWTLVTITEERETDGPFRLLVEFQPTADVKLSRMWRALQWSPQ